MERIGITRAGYESLRKELEHLKTVERPNNIKAIEEARAHGDLSENAEYHEARNEQSFLEGRIQQLEQRIRTAVVIEAEAGGSITMGSTVVYEIDGAREELSIVGSTESDPAAGRISAQPVSIRRM